MVSRGGFDDAGGCLFARFSHVLCRVSVLFEYLAGQIFELRTDVKTPAIPRTDDYVATKPPVLFGHHYASITVLPHARSCHRCNLGMGST